MSRKTLLRTQRVLCAGGAFFISRAAGAEAAESQALQATMDTVWTLVCGFLVFWMNAGFALIESGFVRKKNVANILAKNVITLVAASLIYYALGFALMFGNGNSVLGTTGFFVPDDPAQFEALSWSSVPLNAKFFFQMVFAATAATIVSGAVAERVRYPAYILFSLAMCAVIYPIAGHWVWGGGFLSEAGFLDFAGSTVVHSVGGWAALTGICLLGPRRGKYREDGKIVPILGHSMTSATLGCFVLWLGWFGFNPGSTMAANPEAISHIVLTTNLSAAAASLAATLYTWKRVGMPDLGLTINGALAGLVAITAPCAFVNGPAALIIGTCAGVLVVEGVLLFDRFKLDDPVGATSVHLVNGVFGTVCVGLFADPRIAEVVAGATLRSPGLLLGGGSAQLVAQLTGIAAVGAFAASASALTWLLLKVTSGIRVSEEEEELGLDVTEIGTEAYPEELPPAAVVAGPG